jgi:hypothetical protein
VEHVYPQKENVMSEQIEQNEQRTIDTGYEHVTISDVPPKDNEKLSPYVKVFHVQYKNPDDDTVHTGTFTARRFTAAALAEQAVIKARMNGGLNVAASIDWMNEIRSKLVVALGDNTPEWWSVDDTYDLNLLRAVYEYVSAWEGSFRSRVLAKRRQ